MVAPAAAAVCGWASPRASSTLESEILAGGFYPLAGERGSWGVSAPEAGASQPFRGC